MIKILKLGGYCPVQADIEAFGYYGYFRARGTSASIEFAKTEKHWENNDLEWARYGLINQTFPEAGYLPHWRCKLLIYWNSFKFGLYLLKNY